jgi:hypothetical protein
MQGWLPGSLFIYFLSGTFYADDFTSRKQAHNVNYGTITSLHQFIFSSSVHDHACMFKKELLAYCAPFPADIYYDWWMSMHAARISSLGCIPLKLTWHRMHGANHSMKILSLKDRAERNKKRGRQFIHSLETLLATSGSDSGDAEFLHQYFSLLKKMDGRRFSKAMFFCILKKRKKIFHDKKRNPYFSFHILNMLYGWQRGVYFEQYFFNFYYSSTSGSQCSQQ